MQRLVAIDTRLGSTSLGTLLGFRRERRSAAGNDRATTAHNALQRLSLVVAVFIFVFLSALQAAATPKITLMTPNTSSVGIFVIIEGTGFGTTQGSSTVTFNGTPVTYVSWSSQGVSANIATSRDELIAALEADGKVLLTHAFP